MSTRFKLPRLPTRSRDWRLMTRTSRLVLSIPHYLVLCLILTVTALSVFVLSQNLNAFRDLILFGNLDLGSRFELLVNLYPPLSRAYDLLTSVMLWGVALLVGINLTMLVYHFREHGLKVSEGTGGLAGVILGTLGAGCAACGSAILVGLLSVFGVTSITFLPLDGLEFTIIAVVPLVLSIYWISEGMRGGEINGCPVDI